jgi:hypothetical protein
MFDDEDNEEEKKHKLQLKTSRNLVARNMYS